MDALGTVQHFLVALAHTVATRDIDKHMDLYSRQVALYGVPGHEVMGYDAIALRRRNEFRKGMLLRMIFGTPEILSAHQSVIAYRVEETLKATNGSALALEKEVTLHCEADKRWRIREERITRAQVLPPNDSVLL